MNPELIILIYIITFCGIGIIISSIGIIFYISQIFKTIKKK